MAIIGVLCLLAAVVCAACTMVFQSTLPTRGAKAQSDNSACQNHTLCTIKSTDNEAKHPGRAFFRVLPGGLGENQIFVSSSFFLRSFSI